MNKPVKWITKINFKKAAKIYIVVALLLAVGSLILLGTMFYDKLYTMSKLERLEERIERGNSIAAMQEDFKSLASRSGDIVDILVLDGGNKITFSATNSVFGQGESLNLQKVSDTKNNLYLYDENYPDFLFKHLKDEEFIISKDTLVRFEEKYREYDDDYFFISDFDGREVFGVRYVSSRMSGEKVCLITDVQPVQNGLLYFTIVAALGVLMFMIYWVLIALWVYADAAKSGLNPALWGIVALVTNLACVLVYLIYKNLQTICHKCGALIGRGVTYCVSCGAKVGKECASCGAKISAKDSFCGSCGAKISEDDNVAE